MQSCTKFEKNTPPILHPQTALSELPPSFLPPEKLNETTQDIARGRFLRATGGPNSLTYSLYSTLQKSHSLRLEKK